MMLQQDVPQDFVIATGEQYSVRQFVEWSAAELGITLRFEGSGVNEVGIVDSVEGEAAACLSPGDVIVRVDPRYFRPAEVDSLLGDSTKAQFLLDWHPQVGIREMVSEMVHADLDAMRRVALLKKHGYAVPVALES
jgi:GDPmannose 4,6-dehydratase